MNTKNSDFKYCIVTQPVVPLRAEDDERSEMVSQLLFGEIVEILKKTDNRLKIRNITDNYIGFCDRRMLTVLSENNFETQKKLYAVKISVPIATIYNSENQPITIPYGSTLWLDEGNNCILNNEKYIYDPAQITDLASVTSQEIIRNAKKFLFAPYLWGGKTIFGIDCSGLVQLVLENLGINVPRDARRQVETGTEVHTISSAQQGDLAFFENENKEIVHVGILLNNKQIIHSSACVKIDYIDQKGIISEQTKQYTHKLAIIKRIL
ncbi:MAG: C40 family peptidase [Paludibacter sp.]|nr:C40 family peptidase [Paludibacter sp.]